MPHTSYRREYFKESFHGFNKYAVLLSFFKIATIELTCKMLFKKHKALALIKGWNKHLARCSTDKFTNHSRLRQWFRRMLTWVLHHPFQFKAKQKEGINTKQVWKPKAAVQKEPGIEGPSFQVASTNTENNSISEKQNHQTDEPLSSFEHSTDF